MFLHEIAPKTDFRYLNILNTYNMATIQELACAKYLDEIFQFAKNPQREEKWIDGDWRDARNRIWPWCLFPREFFLAYPAWNYSDIKKVTSMKPSGVLYGLSNIKVVMKIIIVSVNHSNTC